MGVLDYIPGMRSGCPVRNAVVGTAYLGVLTILPVVGMCYRPIRGC